MIIKIIASLYIMNQGNRYWVFPDILKFFDNRRNSMKRCDAMETQDCRLNFPRNKFRRRKAAFRQIKKCRILVSAGLGECEGGSYFIYPIAKKHDVVKGVRTSQRLYFGCNIRNFMFRPLSPKKVFVPCSFGSGNFANVNISPLIYSNTCIRTMFYKSPKKL